MNHTCSFCGHTFTSEDSTCPVCGQTNLSIATTPLEQRDTKQRDRRWGDLATGKGVLVWLYIDQHTESLSFVLQEGQHVLIGRPASAAADETSIRISKEQRQKLRELVARAQSEPSAEPPKPDNTLVDLAPYGASEAGVSRRHVRLEHHGQFISVTDLKSTNGTRLNGGLLTPHQRRIVRDGDNLQLGNLNMRIRFSQLDA